MNEAMFDLPESGFVDRTVTYLRGKSPNGVPVVLLIERRPLEKKTLREAVEEHHQEQRKKHLGYSVMFDREVDVDQHVAIDIGARWNTDDGIPAYTRRTHLQLGETRFIITGEVAFVEREFCDAYMNHVLGTLKFRS